MQCIIKLSLSGYTFLKIPLHLYHGSVEALSLLLGRIDGDGSNKGEMTNFINGFHIELHIEGGKGL